MIEPKVLIYEVLCSFKLYLYNQEMRITIYNLKLSPKGSYFTLLQKRQSIQFEI
jgi:hypothetical protein